jgi:hypothetical protein
MFEGQNEPQDIFSDTEAPAPPQAAGAIQPPRPPGAVPPPAAPGPVPRHGPSKLLLLGILIVVLGIIGGGVYLYLQNTGSHAPTNTGVIPAPSYDNDVIVNQAPVNTNTPSGNANVPSPDTNVNAGTNANANVNAPVEVPPPPADSDGDGLSDEEEATLGTDPQAADTDNDGLSDREEVQIYHTDPRNPDTDGDGFQDGAEVRAGYDPNGPGRLFTVPPQP